MSRTVQKSPIHPQRSMSSFALHYFENIICDSCECRKMMRSIYHPGFFASQRTQTERVCEHLILRPPQES
ncbi:hypothetical protein LguiA_013277 [Lonicera macranthoides]